MSKRMLSKSDYITETESDIEELLKDTLLSNYKNQIFAWKLNAEFKRSYKESFLYNRALFLSSNSCLLINNEGNGKIAISGLKESAEIYEYLSDLNDINEKYDREYLILKSALCYDLSGYQANAFCVASRLDSLVLKSETELINVEIDNLIIEQVILILLKKIPLAQSKLQLYKNDDLGFLLFKKALNSWYSYILKLDESNFIRQFDDAYKYFLNIGNTYLSHLIFLLKTRVLLFENRSIFNNLNQYEFIESSKNWRKYIKLLAYDYYTNNRIKEIDKRKSIFELWTSQLRAIEGGLIAKDENFVIQMPTSAGKTFIAELSILKYLIKYPKKKCIYIAPFRALTSEKEIELAKYFSKMGYSVSALSGSYEVDEFQDLILSETDILIATPEKIDLLLRLNPNFFNDISFMVVDEGHIIGDYSTRATLLEFLIIRLKIKIPELKTLFISAVMPSENANEYAIWLSGKEENVLRSLLHKESPINEEWEPTRKLISYFEWEGKKGNITFQNVIREDEETKIKYGAKLYSFIVEKEFSNRFPLKNNKPQSAATLAYKLSEEGNTLVFCAQVPRIKSVATAFLKLLSNIEKEQKPSRFIENETKESSYYADIWYGNDSYITQSINLGIGIHYGDMPEQVRNAVESDFRKGLLTVLLSTNTIGQGLNFPIKNLIFYETQIGRNLETEENIYIQKRDFWNIVGRAGRAGKETEGNIVFIINSSTDKRKYKEFINKDNIENANSLFFSVAEALFKGRISGPKLDDLLSILSETYLLDLMTEEIIGTDYQELIEKIINNSLFKVQLDKRDFDVEPLKNGFNKIFKSIEEKATFKQLQIYKTTGFSLKSNLVIDEFIDHNIDSLKGFVREDNYLNIIKCFLRLLSENDIDEMNDYKLDKFVTKPSDFYDIIEDWVVGNSINEILEKWKLKKMEIVQFHIFVSKALYYLYPWGISSFISILAFKLNKSVKELPENIKSLSSYLKFGLNEPTSCLCRSLGIKGREVSIFLYQSSNKLEGKVFIVWLSNLTNLEIDTFALSRFDKQNIRNVSLKLTPNSYREIPEVFNFKIQGSEYNDYMSHNSKSVVINDFLSYKRDDKNEYDPYAILVHNDGKELGYIPREYAKLLSAEIEIEESKYDIRVVNVFAFENYNEIEVEMNKSS
ncbi:DEAD/DEAH box helicase [Olleya namhaensis]|uniref:DEAD/DEAH box helicase n=1 Tax=Olleya namhaensis TaxID=1144750 RepID=UPI00232C3C46|nr:DEAD/DEAH box helicase [Olleya namhaensis]